MAIGNLDLIAKPSLSGNRSRRPMKAGEKPPVLHRGINLQADFISGRIALKILAEGNFSPFAIMPLEFVPGFPLLGADAFDHS